MSSTNANPGVGIEVALVRKPRLEPSLASAPAAGAADFEPQVVMVAPGVMVLQLNGAPAGQTVFHLHFHVIPRFHGIDLKFHARSMEAPEKLKANAEKIKAALAS